MGIKINLSQEIKILRKIIFLTNSELDLDYILQEIVNIVSEISQADSVFVYLIDDKKENLCLKASKIPHTSILSSINLKIGEGVTGWVALKNEPVSIPEEAFNDKRFKSFDILEEDKFEALLSVPIVNKDEIIGVINVQHKLPHKHTPSMIKLITLISAQVSGVINNAKLYEYNKIKAQQFDSLVKISNNIISEKYIDEILDLIVVVISELLNTKICSIMLVDNKGEYLQMKATKSLSDRYKKKPPVKINTSISGQVIKSKKIRAIYDVKNEKNYMFNELAIQENLSSLLIVPMIFKENVIGVINVYTKKPHIFTQEECDIMQIISNQAAISIENTKLMKDFADAKEALESRKKVEQAKGFLMKKYGLTEEDAYKYINKKSMNSGIPMKSIAESIILMADLEI